MVPLLIAWPVLHWHEKHGRVTTPLILYGSAVMLYLACSAYSGNTINPIIELALLLTALPAYGVPFIITYASHRIGMVVILPDNAIADTVRQLDGNEMRSLLKELRGPPRSVDVSLPRFKTSFSASLKEPFEQMGMHRAFDWRTSDFSGMTGKSPSLVKLAIDQISHRAVIDVAEEGAEAAAATGIAVVTRAVMPRPTENFHVDRPFLFAVVDEETGAILFEGRIVDPR